MTNVAIKPINQWKTDDILNLVKGVDKKTWLIAGVSSVGVILFSIFFVWPAWFNRVGVDREIKLLENRIVTVETLKRRKPEMLKTKTDYEKLIDDVKERLFLPGETAFLLGTISQLAEESGVTIIASRPHDYDEKFPPPFNKQYEGSLYEFTVEGNYHQLGQFVSQIESYKKVLRIESFDTKPIKNKEGQEYSGIMVNVKLTAVSIQ